VGVFSEHSIVPTNLYNLVLPRCQLVMSCGASVRLSYMYWMTSILVSGTYRCTLIDEITRRW